LPSFAQLLLHRVYSKTHLAESRLILPAILAFSGAIGGWYGLGAKQENAAQILDLCSANFLRSTFLSAGVVAASAFSFIGKPEARFRDPENNPVYQDIACRLTTGQIIVGDEQLVTLPDGRRANIKIAIASPMTMVVSSDAGYAPVFGIRVPGQFHDQFSMRPYGGCGRPAARSIPAASQSVP
jgi:hypothetical protein